MPGSISPIPEGFHTVTPHMVVKDVDRALAFYEKAFGAQVQHVHRMPGGQVMHAAMKIGDSVVMLNDEFPDCGCAVAFVR